MKNLMGEEHYCYNIHTSLTKSSAHPHPPFYREPPIWINLPFLTDNLDPPPSFIFDKYQPPKNKGRGESHYGNVAQ